MSTVTQLRPRMAPRAVAPQRRPPVTTAGDGHHFWCAAIGGSVGMTVELAVHIDLVSDSIMRLPQRALLTRPAAATYLQEVKTLARAWRGRLRPALEKAVHALAGAGATIIEPTLRRNGPARLRPGKSGGPLPPALTRRMAGAVALLDTLAADVDRTLEQMVRATRELDTDTVQLSERLQADQVHALMLSQQASTLQSKLDDATMRQHAYWLLGPHAEQIRQEIAMHSSAREGVRRQLDHLRAEQLATEAEARYLQLLLPSLSTFLAGCDRLGGALRVMLGGSRALLSAWRQDGACGAAIPDDDLLHQLMAAAPHWETLAAMANRLQRVRMPNGCRT